MVSDPERHSRPEPQPPEEASDAGEAIEWPDRSHFSEFDAAIARALAGRSDSGSPTGDAQPDRQADRSQAP
jgi:hypothetical protein